MRLTTKSEYALVALIHMARHTPSGYVRIADICHAHHISKKYLEQLFSVLRRMRVVRTRRGAAGGYALAQPPRKISVARVVRMMDGALAPSSSVSKYFFARTPLAREKKMMCVLKDIRDYVARKLEQLTLADLV